jgi:hypothetical protein
MTIKEVIEKNGRVTAEFTEGTVQGIVNGYELEIEKIPYTYTIYLFVNGGIRKFFETIEGVDSFLKSLQ